MAAPTAVSDVPRGLLSGYAQGCRCPGCGPAGEHLSADGTPEDRRSLPRLRTKRRATEPLPGLV
jgi:hypothetical protein